MVKETAGTPPGVSVFGDPPKYILSGGVDNLQKTAWKGPTFPPPIRENFEASFHWLKVNEIYRSMAMHMEKSPPKPSLCYPMCQIGTD